MVTNKSYSISGFTSVRGARSHAASLKHTDGCPRLLLTQLAMSLGYVRAVKDFLVPE